MPGSSANTSRPARTRLRRAPPAAPPRRRRRRARCSAGSRRVHPARNSASTRFRVSLVAGTCRVTMSEAASSSSRTSHIVDAELGGARLDVRRAVGLRQQPGRRSRRRRPLGHAEPDRAQADDAERRAEEPVRLAVASSSPSGRRAGRRRCRRSCGRWRAAGPWSARRRRRSCGPGTLATRTPRARPRPVSMVLVPAPARITRASRSAASNTPLRHLGAAHDQHVDPAIRPGRSVGAEAGSTTHCVAARLELGDGLVGDRVGEQVAACRNLQRRARERSWRTCSPRNASPGAAPRVRRSTNAPRQRTGRGARDGI